MGQQDWDRAALVFSNICFAIAGSIIGVIAVAVICLIFIG